MWSIFIKTNLLFGLIALTAACSTAPKNADEHFDWSAEKFYTEAKKALVSGYYEKSIKLYEKLESRYPFGPYAAQSQLDVAYAYYKFQEPDSAIAAANRFIKIHPRNPHVDYAYYLKGLINYNRGIGFLERVFPTDSSQRDPGAARDALRVFSNLNKKFPDSRYARDSRKRIVALRNNLAMYEIHVANFYLRREAYVAAADRAVYVIENYQRTPAVPLALKVLEGAYDNLKLADLSDDITKVYAHNYDPNAPPPGSIPPEQRAWSRKLWDFIGLDQ